VEAVDGRGLLRSGQGWDASALALEAVRGETRNLDPPCRDISGELATGLDWELGDEASRRDKLRHIDQVLAQLAGSAQGGQVERSGWGLASGTIEAGAITFAYASPACLLFSVAGSGGSFAGKSSGGRPGGGGATESASGGVSISAGSKGSNGGWPAGAMTAGGP
jgi:hypothetical protein